MVLPQDAAALREMSVAEVSALFSEAGEVELAVLAELAAEDQRKGVQMALRRAEKRVEALKAEQARLNAMYDFEAQVAAQRGGTCWVGLDEVGRGPIAGPLCVGAVVLPAGAMIEGLNDSKQVSAARREEIAAQIERVAVASAVVFVDNNYIDAHGMTAALKFAFSSAVAEVELQLARRGVALDVVLLDGNPLRFDAREVNIVKGDAKCASIAAASILAKVKRDALMVELAKDYPAYHWDSNKGYGSTEHIAAIEEFGLSPLHRVTFCTGFKQMALF